MHVLLFHSHTPVHVYLFIIELDYFTKSEHNNLIISIALINHIKIKKTFYLLQKEKFVHQNLPHPQNFIICQVIPDTSS